MLARRFDLIMSLIVNLKSIFMLFIIPDDFLSCLFVSGLTKLYIQFWYYTKECLFLRKTQTFPPNFLAKKFSVNGKFLQILGGFSRKSVEAVRLRKTYSPAN